MQYVRNANHFMAAKSLFSEVTEVLVASFSIYTSVMVLLSVGMIFFCGKSICLLDYTIW
jgi:hypothetical protein